ncbi:hypothetical protein B0T17DRAFT_614249 [Bombardia bombarda]|uniref:SRR1-like domain-containing protein n=1 Tax=Bombardia bombarda TaxID=252184 RepID=A0AA39X6Q0_9PEZI|nr:hypothetical protein B0T17DRAFT_614249 [Bombardia bombarda]
MTAAPEREWSQVSRKRGHLRHVKTPTSKTNGKAEKELVQVVESLLLGIRPNPNPEYTVGDIQKHHQFVKQSWESSECWKVLKEILVSALSSGFGRPPINKAVCLGPGPYDPSNGSSAARRTAHMQTAAFCSIVDLLESESSGSQKIKRVIQEPAFTQVDKDFCIKLGFDVAETPAAFSMVDESTILFGIHMELRTYHQALSTLPCLFIGGGVEEWESVADYDPEIRPLLSPMSKMAATYDRLTFPDLNYIFSSTTIYWRRGENQSRSSSPVFSVAEDTKELSVGIDSESQTIPHIPPAQDDAPPAPSTTEDMKETNEKSSPTQTSSPIPPTTEEIEEASVVRNGVVSNSLRLES